MTRTRFTLAVLLAALAASSAHAGLFQRKAKIDAARAKHLVDVLRSDPDERKRKAAVAELRDADPRTHGEIMSALVTSLQRDPAAGVRAESADTLRHYKVVSPVAGVALETAAESDSSPVVRDAAQQALWEYHLGGYRSAKGTDGFAGQTAEPPLARPTTRVARAAPAAVVVPASGVKPEEVVSLSPPPVAPPPALDVTPPAAGIRTVVSAAPPAVLNQTAEPPLAKPAPVAEPVFTVAPLSIPTGPNRFRGANPPPRRVSLPAEGQADW